VAGPPIFPADEEKTRIAGLLHIILLGQIVGFGVYSALALVVPAISVRRFLIGVPIVLFAVVLLLVSRRGFVRPASAAYSAGLWVISTVIILISGGVRAPAFSGYFIIVLIAGILLGWRAALGFAGLSLVTGVALLYATITNRLPVPYLTHTDLSTWATQTLFLLMATVVLSLARRSIDTAMQRVREELAERKRAEVALRESEERYRQIVETAAEGIWRTDASHRTTFVNPKLASLLGYRVEELVGQSLFAFLDAEGQALVAAKLDRRRQGVREQYDVRLWRKDGTALWGLVSASPILDEQGCYAGGLAMITDITARRQAEAARASSEARLRAIFDGAAIGIALVDMAGHPIETNPTLTAMLGYTADELREMTFAAFTHPEDVDADLALFGELIAGSRESYQITKRYIRKDGQVVWGNLRVSLIRDSQGAPQFAIGMAEDITERQQAEAALRTYTGRLEYLRDIDQITLSTPSVNEIAEAVIRRLRTLLPYNRAELFLIDWEVQEGVIIAQVSDRPTSLPVGYRYSLADRPPVSELLEGQIVVEHDLSNDVPTSPGLQRLWDEGMRARMIVPLLVQGRLLGMIHLVADRPYMPTDDQRSLARELADHLAIGLQNARLLTEMQAANAGLQALSRQLVTAQEDERRRIARELHDEIAQTLALVKLNVRAVQRGRAPPTSHRGWSRAWGSSKTRCCACARWRWTCDPVCSTISGWWRPCAGMSISRPGWPGWPPM
jgi:PAS domain S-box-containing protein